MKNTTAKKFKYGSLSVVFTVVFIALVIGVNLIVSALDTSFNLRVDLTETELYSISPETDVALRAGLGDNYESFKVTIKFLDERDVIESSETALYVQQLAEEYARQYPNNISVEYIDITKNPGAVEKYLNETQTSVDRNYVIIEGAYHYRIWPPSLSPRRIRARSTPSRANRASPRRFSSPPSRRRRSSPSPRSTAKRPPRR